MQPSFVFQRHARLGGVWFCWFPSPGVGDRSPFSAGRYEYNRYCRGGGEHDEADGWFHGSKSTEVSVVSCQRSKQQLATAISELATRVEYPCTR